MMTARGLSFGEQQLIRIVLVASFVYSGRQPRR